jgi:hypothetical protein
LWKDSLFYIFWPEKHTTTTGRNLCHYVGNEFTFSGSDSLGGETASFLNGYLILNKIIVWTRVARVIVEKVVPKLFTPIGSNTWMGFSIILSTTV